MKDFPSNLEAQFELHANSKIALGQKAYLRDQFEFYGIKTTDRRQIQKPFFVKEFLPPKNELTKTTKFFWEKPQREYQYFSQELAYQYIAHFKKKDIHLFEFMITHKSWWDTVDFVAVKLVGEYMKIFPSERDEYIQKWITSNNVWLQRTALLFQLKYRENLDTELLGSTIHSLLGSKEFFINKAIGWILREYSKTDPNWVMDFVKETALNPLSKKEALRLLN